MTITFNGLEVSKISASADNQNTVDSPLRDGLNTVVDGKVTLTRNINAGKNSAGGNHYLRQYLSYENLPNLEGANLRCFLEGLKVVSKSFYKSEDWNQLDTIDWSTAADAIEAELASRDSKAYQAELSGVIERFSSMCEALAQKKGKDVKLYKPFVNLLKQVKQIEVLSPARLSALRSLWSAFLKSEGIKHKEHTLSGEVSRPIQNLNRGVWFDRYDTVTVSEEDLADLV